MIVYRVENAEGEGPYWHSVENAIGISIGTIHNKCHNHPAPSEDIVDTQFDRFSNQWYYGCLSLEQLVKWFTLPENYFPLLREKGFYIVAYECEDKDVAKGDKQCAFKRGRARRNDKQLEFRYGMV